MSEKGRKVIDKIRGEIQKKVLETGRHWIPTVNGIPIGQLTTDELRELLKEIKEKYPEAIDKFEALNLLDDKRYKFNELAAKVWEERAEPAVEESVRKGGEKEMSKKAKIYEEITKLRKLRDDAWRKAETLGTSKEGIEANRAGKNYQLQIDYLMKEMLEAIKAEEKVPEEKIPETKIPEGVEVVKYTFVNEKDAEVTETIFDAITTGKYEFRSAVNIGTMVRCVMYEKGEKVGTPVRVIVTDKDMAWHLQQLIDWCLRRQAKILATRREGKVVEVAFRMEGIKPMAKEEKERLWYHFKKVDGWSLVSEEK